MTDSVTTQKIETTILNNLIFNEEYTRKVIPFIKEDYFQDGVEKVLFRTIGSYVEKYKINPELETYVTDKAISGLFFMLAQQEIDIRENPKERTSALLKKVFSN